MKERPILFNGPMVRAILEGRKTQTRRVCKLQPHEAAGMTWWPDGHGTDTGTGGGAPGCYLKLCTYGQPGDRLWVCETWSTHACFDAVPPAQLTTRSLHYWADGKIETGKGRPSIHMPRWASRITLEITGVRVERLNDISEADAKAEGIGAFEVAFSGDKRRDPITQQHPPVRFADAFCDLWESINGPGSWDANPWVWVIELNRVEGGAA